MAIVTQYIASVQVWDSARKLGSASFYVSETDAKAYAAAADSAARAASKVGLLLNSALKGKGAMAAQGGGEFSDFEIGRAVVFMANKGGAKFDEPKPPAAAASAASAPK